MHSSQDASDIVVNRPDHSVRLCCEHGWLSVQSMAGVQLVERIGEAADVVRPDTVHPRMVSAEDTSADELVVGLEAFLQLVGGAEHHKDFSFSNMLAGMYITIILMYI